MEPRREPACWSHQSRHERGQGLVEFALVLPILIVLIISVGELGLIFGKINSLGYASREGARVGCRPGAGHAMRR